MESHIDLMPPDPLPFSCSLQYPIEYLPNLRRPHESGWEVKYSHPWVQVWRWNDAHCVTLSVAVTDNGQSFLFPEAWVAGYATDLFSEDNLDWLTQILDEKLQYPRAAIWLKKFGFSNQHIEGVRLADRVQFSGSARTLEEVEDIASSLREQVRKLRDGSDSSF